jgi:hypothetical protein
MIKATDLRIGNWVSIKNNYRDSFQNIQILNGDHLSHILNEHPEHVINYTEPIPLTKEILEKCGFEKDNEQKFNGIIESYSLDIDVKGSNKNTIHFNLPGNTRIKNKELYNFGNYTVNDHWGSNNFKYLHQLQNLYYALTGEELNVNL